MHSIRVTYDLTASHALRKGNELLEEPHSHTFRIEVECSSDKLDEAGCIVDFRDLDARMSDILGSYTNANLHEHPKFHGTSPSAEIIAEVFFADISSSMADMPARLERVTVWEDERHAGCFRGER